MFFFLQHRLQFFYGGERHDFNGEDTTFQGLHFQFARHDSHGSPKKTFKKKSSKGSGEQRLTKILA